MPKKFLSRASLVCGAVCMLCACTLVGCGREGSSKPTQSPPAPTRTKDPQLKSKLQQQISERDVLNGARQTIVEKMNDLVENKYKGDMKAAANDPEMISLIRRARDIETNFASNRAHTAEMIRARAIEEAAQEKALKKEVKK